MYHCSLASMCTLSVAFLCSCRNICIPKTAICDGVFEHIVQGADEGRCCTLEVVFGGMLFVPLALLCLCHLVCNSVQLVAITLHPFNLVWFLALIKAVSGRGTISAA